MGMFVALALIGLIAQLIDGTLGMAYGATSSTLLLSYGLTPLAASASVHMAEVATTFVSGAAHLRFGNVDWRMVRRLGVPGAVGAGAGAMLLSNVSTDAATPWMAVLLMTLGAYVFARFGFMPAIRPRGRPYVRGRYLASLGLVAGFVDATGGGGWGPLTSPTLLALGKSEPRKIIGSVATAEFLVAGTASVAFILNLDRLGVSSAIVVPLLVGGVIAAPVAAWLVRHVPPRPLGVTAGTLIVTLNVRSLHQVFELSVRGAVYIILGVIWGTGLLFAIRRHLQERRLQLPDEPAPRRAADPAV